MLKKIALAVLFAVTFCPVASLAQVRIRIGPPAPVIEVPGNPPERGYVWIDGYHRYEGGRYVWTQGHWERPPHEHARWEKHRWVHRHGEWILIEGRWR